MSRTTQLYLTKPYSYNKKNMKKLLLIFSLLFIGVSVFAGDTKKALKHLDKQEVKLLTKIDYLDDQIEGLPYLIRQGRIEALKLQLEELNQLRYRLLATMDVLSGARKMKRNAKTSANVKELKLRKWNSTEDARDFKATVSTDDLDRNYDYCTLLDIEPGEELHVARARAGLTK